MAITAILGALAGIGSAIGAGAGAVGGAAAGAAGAIGSGLAGAAGAVGSGLGAAGSAIGSGLGAAGSALGSAGGAIGSGLGQAAGAIGQGLGTVGANIGQGLGVAGQGISQGFSQAVGPMSQALQGIGGGGGGINPGMFSGMMNMGGGGGGRSGGGGGMMSFTGAPQGAGGFRGQLSGNTPIWQTPGINPSAPSPTGGMQMPRGGGAQQWSPLGALDNMFGGGGGTPQRVAAPMQSAPQPPSPSAYQGWTGVGQGGPRDMGPMPDATSQGQPTFAQRVQGAVDQYIDPSMQRRILQGMEQQQAREHEARMNRMNRRFGGQPMPSGQLGGGGIMDLFPQMVMRNRPQYQPFGR